MPESVTAETTPTPPPIIEPEPLRNSRTHVGEFVPLSSLVPSKTNVRSEVAKEGLRELADSIRAHGILEPLLVRPRGGVPASRYEIVAGHRRYSAAKIAKLAVVPVIIRELSDAQAQEIQIIENVQREGIHPLDEGLGYKALLAIGEQTAADVAAKVGKSESYIWQRMKLAALILEAQAAFRESRIHAGHALHICRLQPADQLRALDFCLTRNSRGAANKADRKKLEAAASTRELTRFIGEAIHLDLNKAVFPIADAQLVKKAGACTTCPKRAGNNPGLFADILATKTDANTCTDPACYQSKLAAHFQAKLAELGKGARLLSVHHMADKYHKDELPAGTIGTDKWKPAGKTQCSATVPGIIADGGYSDTGKHERAQQLMVCVDPKCRAHWRTGSGSSFSKSQDQKAKERRAKATTAARAAVARAVIQKAKWPLPETGIRQLAEAFAERLDFDSLRAACKVMDWLPADGKLGTFDFRGQAKKRLAAMKVPELGKWFTLCLVAPDLVVRPYMRDGDAGNLGLLAKRSKINLAAATRKSIAEADAKAKGKTKVKDTKSAFRVRKSKGAGKPAKKRKTK